MFVSFLSLSCLGIWIWWWHGLGVSVLEQPGWWYFQHCQHQQEEVDEAVTQEQYRELFKSSTTVLIITETIHHSSATADIWLRTSARCKLSFLSIVFFENVVHYTNAGCLREPNTLSTRRNTVDVLWHHTDRDLLRILRRHLVRLTAITMWSRSRYLPHNPGFVNVTLSGAH